MGSTCSGGTGDDREDGVVGRTRQIQEQAAYPADSYAFVSVEPQAVDGEPGRPFEVRVSCLAPGWQLKQQLCARSELTSCWGRRRLRPAEFDLLIGTAEVDGGATTLGGSGVLDGTKLTAVPTPAAVEHWRSNQGSQLLLYGGKLVGSPIEYNNTLQILDGSSLQTAHSQTLSPGRSGAAGVVWDSRVYIMGGFNKVRTDRVDVLDLVELTWSAGPPLPEPVVRAGAAVLDGGRICLVGGYTQRAGNDAYLRETHWLDADQPGAGWTPGGMMLSHRTLCGCATVDGRVYVCGGYTGDTFLDTVEVWDPADPHWRALARMPGPKSSCAIGVIGSALVLAGGFDGQRHTSSVYRLDTLTGHWETISRMSHPRTGARAAVVGGRMYVVGGWFKLGSTDIEPPQPGEFPEDKLGKRDAVFLGSGERLEPDDNGRWSRFSCARRIDPVVLSVDFAPDSC